LFAILSTFICCAVIPLPALYRARIIESNPKPFFGFSAEILYPEL
jgi:hypothetical protein